MFVAAAVNKVSHDVALRVDPIRIRQNGSREIDGGKGALAEQKAMLVAAAVNRSPHDVASRIDINGKRLRGSRDIDGGKAPIAK